MRKAQEDELTRARDEAESASRAKTQFLANMSHELRTPLNAVIGFSEILNRELFGALGEQRYRDYARMIHESGEHLLHVVNDILDMSKIEAGKLKLVKEPFDVGSLIASCTEVMRHAAEAKHLSLVTEVAPGMPELIADKRACKQMLLNVISNAIKFTDAGGSVRVAAREESGMVELIVADTGIGISEQDLPKLGNPFVQADNAYNRSHDGAGLGLSVVKGLAPPAWRQAGDREQARPWHHDHDSLAARAPEERIGRRNWSGQDRDSGLDAPITSPSRPVY